MLDYIAHGNHRILGQNNGYIYRYCRSDGYELTSHLHECYEFVYITEGHCVYTIEGREHIVSPGDLIFTRPNELHSFSFPEKCTFTRQFLHIYSEYIDEFPVFDEFFHSEKYIDKGLIPSYLVEKYEIDNIFSTLQKYSDISYQETYLIAYSSAIQLMAKIMLILKTEKLNSQNNTNHKSINNIINYINFHLKEDISLDDIANATFMSPVYISRLFKSKIGMNLKTYINMRRIVIAKNMMLQNEKISNIYDKCGFKNYSTFYRAFVRFVGMSPEQFKARSNELN